MELDFSDNAMPLREPAAAVVQSKILAESVSFASVKRYWRDIVTYADMLDKDFGEIVARVDQLKKWECKGLVRIEDLQQASEWLEQRKDALRLFFGRMKTHPFLSDYFSDGAGI